MNMVQEKRFWEELPELSEQFLRIIHSETLNEVAKIYDRKQWLSALRVGRAAYGFAMEEWGDIEAARIAALSGLFHHAIDAYYYKFNITLDRESLSVYLHSVLHLKEDKDDIVEKVAECVLTHRGVNNESDSKELIVVKDAKRYVDLCLDNMIYLPRFYMRLPLVYFGNQENPNATPRSILDMMEHFLQYVDPTSKHCIQTKTAMRDAQRRADKLRSFLADLRDQLKLEFLLPN